MGCFRLVILIVLISSSIEPSEAELSKTVFKMIKKMNQNGPYIGLLAPSNAELQPLFNSPSFKPSDSSYTHIDCAGRRFHFARIEDRKVIMVMTGKSMINAAIATQILCNLFSVKAILHYGLAGNANHNLNIGDITVPQFWAHTGLWNWQRYGQGPDDELPYESKGDCTRDYGYLNFADYNDVSDNGTASPDNLLNNIWYQPEEIFRNCEAPEFKETAFWIPTGSKLFQLAKQLEGMALESCMDKSTCLPKTPQLVTVNRGSSSSVYLDNVAYKTFLHSKFQVSPVDMESAAIALISHQQKIPFVAFRALNGHADDANTFFSLLIQNCLKVVLHFIKNMDDDVDDIASM